MYIPADSGRFRPMPMPIPIPIPIRPMPMPMPIPNYTCIKKILEFLRVIFGP
jgi:hypothetical protein